MKTAIQWAGINTAAYIVITLAAFLLGFQTEKIEQGQYFQWIGMPVFIIVVLLGLREAGALAGAKGYSYGAGVLTSLQIGVFTGLFSAVYAWIHFSFINPDFADYVVGMTLDKMEAEGAPAEAMDQVEPVVRFMSRPAVQAIFGFIFSIFMSVLIGLIASAFLKRAPAPPAVAAES